jgi:hypothetical protein
MPDLISACLPSLLPREGKTVLCTLACHRKHLCSTDGNNFHLDGGRSWSVEKVHCWRLLCGKRSLCGPLSTFNDNLSSE